MGVKLDIWQKQEHVENWQIVVLCADQNISMALQFAYMVFKDFMKKKIEERESKKWTYKKPPWKTNKQNNNNCGTRNNATTTKQWLNESLINYKCIHALILL